MQGQTSVTFEGGIVPPPLDVVIIDDEESISEGCRQTLEEAGYRAAAAYDGMNGIELVRNQHPRMAIIDLKMPGIDGYEVLNQISTLDPNVAVLIITGYGSIDDAVRLMKGGAFDLLTKPFAPEKLLEAVKRGMEIVRDSKKAAVTSSIPMSHSPVSAAQKRLNGLLKGLEGLGDAYSAGVEQQRFLKDILAVEEEAAALHKSPKKPIERERAIREIVEDLRFVDGVIEKYEYRKNNLIQILLEINNRFGWLPPHTRKWIARRLEIPETRILSIAEFYETLLLKPQGKHKIHVCTGTACHVRGAENRLQQLTKALGLKVGETDARGEFTLEAVHCLGCCAMAPVMKIDDEYYGNISSQELTELLGKVRENDKENKRCDK